MLSFLANFIFNFKFLRNPIVFISLSFFSPRSLLCLAFFFVSVLTHAGRTADSGHYIGWVKKSSTDQDKSLTDSNSESLKRSAKTYKSPQDEDWWKYDDDKVTLVRGEDIEKLDGGGDWHSGIIFGSTSLYFFLS